MLKPNPNKRSNLTTPGAFLGFLAFALITLVAATPISSLKLQGDANAGGNSLTNAATVSATNGYFNNLVATNGITGPVATTNLVGTVTNLVSSPTVTSTNFTGNGGGLTNLPAANITGIVSTSNGGTGTSSPALVAGTNIVLAGSFPAQTVSTSSNVVTTTGNFTISGTNIFSGPVIVGTNTPIYDANPSGQAYLGVGNSTSYGGIYVGLFCSHGGASDGLANGLYLAISADGKSWSMSSAPVITPSTFGDSYVGDPSIIRYNGKFYVAFTASNNSGHATGEFRIASSTDLINWTNVASVNTGLGSGYYTGSPRLFLDTGNNDLPYIFFASGPAISTQALYGMQASDTTLANWPSPTQVLGTSREDPFVIKIGSTYELWYSSITDSYNIEVATASSPLGTYTVAQSGSNWTGLGTSREAAFLLPQPGGSYRLYASALSTGPYYYATSSSPTTTNSFTTASTMQVAFTSITNGIPILVNDVDSMRTALAATLELGFNSPTQIITQNAFYNATPFSFTCESMVSSPAFTITNEYNTDFATVASFLTPSLSTGKHTNFTWGVSPSTGNTAGWEFYYAGSGSSSNLAELDFYGTSPILTAMESGNVGIGTTSPGTLLEVNGTATIDGSINSKATQTTLSGSTAGSAVCSMPFAGSSYKKAIIFLNGFNGSATYTFPTAFTSTNTLTVDGPLVADVVVTATNASITTTTNTSGEAVVEGY